MYVYVITSPEDGWDCVAGVIAANSLAHDEDPVVFFCKAYFGYTDDQAQEASENFTYVAHYQEVIY